jgi:tRNA threonylcarbamoyl adenosine modification protein YjeE
MSRRLEGVHLAGSWEFPGGKIEPYEAPQDTLKRELQEELNIEVEVGEVYAVGHHSYPSKDVVLIVYECWHTAREPQALEVAELAWLTPQEVCALPLPPADEEMLRRLRVEAGLSDPAVLPVWSSDSASSSSSSSAPSSVSFASLDLKVQTVRGCLGGDNPHLEFCVTGLEETWQVGEWLGRGFATLLSEDQEGSALPLLVAATGDLGAGKTSLAQGIARGLGVPSSAYVNSPTFSLLQSHPFELDHQTHHLHHVDLYRLDDEDELIELGFDELSEGVLYVEWPERGPSLFNRPHFVVALRYPEGSTSSRLFKLSLVGFDPDEVLITFGKLMNPLDKS